MSESPENPTPQSQSPEDVRALLNFLESRDIHCPICHYNLRRLTEPRCPECGRDIRLTVGTLEPYLSAWIVTLVLIAMPAGVGILTVIGIVQEGFPPLAMLSEDPMTCIAIIYTLLAMPLTIVSIASRRTFWKLPRTAQRTVAWIAFFTDAAVVAGCLISSR